MDLQGCFKNGLIKKIKPDKDLINSIIIVSNSKKIAVFEANITKITISAYFSLSYDSLREIFEVICIKKGYKVLSHICIGLLLKENLSMYEYNFFDRVGKIRNGINYYGEGIGLENGVKLIDKIFVLREELIDKYIWKRKKINQGPFLQSAQKDVAEHMNFSLG